MLVRCLPLLLLVLLLVALPTPSGVTAVHTAPAHARATQHLSPQQPLPRPRAAAEVGGEAQTLAYAHTRRDQKPKRVQQAQATKQTGQQHSMHPADPSEAITKASLDPRSYKALVLANGLKVLLVSDPHGNSAAAALSVGTGSFSDPDDTQGLAHFLEHMLFLGTHKYPSETEYDNYISSHGGRNNAYTASEETCFYFSILPDALEGALDRFAQFFISPLLSESSTGREMHAVDAEHSKNLLRDGWRGEAVLSALADPQVGFLVIEHNST